MPPWQVRPYTHEALCELVAEGSNNARARIEEKIHAVYFREYFEHLRALTIVVENDYIDHDFLEDFAAYYVRCFEQYPRSCRRLHFFSAEVDQAGFSAMLAGDAAIGTTLQKSYLGFVVVRPLPERVFGRTCLRCYPPGDGRHFPITREYKANLFGLDLSVETIAFQEQDRAVAACATSALWSVFHGTGYKFHHRIPSPVEITRNATAKERGSRAIPATDGLTLTQMADAVRACDLEPYCLPGTEPDFMRAAIYAYLCAGIPILMDGELFEGSRLPEKLSGEGEAIPPLGVHGVAVTGFFLGKRPKPEADGFTLLSSRIEKFYCHDDRVGPFARMELEAQPADPGTTILTTSMSESNDRIGDWVYLPDALLIPLYHKIRVPFVRVYQEVRAFDKYLRTLRTLPDDDGDDISAGPAVDIPELEWDIRLTTVNDYKRECIGDARVSERRSILESRMPKFIWLARGISADRGEIDLLFDATGLELSNLCFATLDRGTNLLTFLRALAEESELHHPNCEGVIDTLLARNTPAA
jgi:hypothetical protein